MNMLSKLDLHCRRLGPCILWVALTASTPVALADEGRAIEDVEDVFLESFANMASGSQNLAFGAALASDTFRVQAAAGPLHQGTNDQVGPDARWHIGSITKSFTAVLTLQLVAEGVVDLDAPIETYLPRHRAGMHADWRSITLRELLSNTSGLPRDVVLSDLFRNWPADPRQARADVLSRYWGDPLDGSVPDFQYSNIGYVLAGFVTEEVTGQSWETLIQSRIAAPLGLESVGVGAPVHPTSAWGHRKVLGIRSSVDPVRGWMSDNPAWIAPAGGLHMTMDDLMSWGMAVMDACAGKLPDFLSAELCRIMQTPVANDYALGWIRQQSSETSESLMWHNGSNTMWYALLVLLPERRTALAIAHNSGVSMSIDQMANDMIDELTSAR